MGISLGDAILHIRGDRTGLESDLAGAGTSISGWATKMAAAIGGAVTVAKIAQALRRTIEETVAYGTEIRRLDSITGQGAEASSRLLQVFEDFNVEGGQVTMMLRTLASQGLSPTIETIAQLSDRYLALAPGVERATFLQDNFGRSGADLAVVMEQGSAVLLARNAGVERGLVLSQQDIDQTEALRQAQDGLDDAWKSIATTIAMVFVPGLTAVFNGLARSITPTEDLMAATRALNAQIAAAAPTYATYTQNLARTAAAQGLLVITQDRFNEVRRLGHGLEIEARDAIVQSTEAEWQQIQANQDWGTSEERRLGLLREGPQLYERNTEAAEEYGRTVANIPSTFALSVVSDISGDLARIGEELRIGGTDLGRWAFDAGQRFQAQFSAGMVQGPEAAETAEMLSGIIHDQFLIDSGATAGERRRALLDLGWTPAEVAAYMANPFAYIQAYFDAHPIQLTFVGGPSGVPGAGIPSKPGGHPGIDKEQRGGAWTVGGESGTDRNLVQFMASRGEHVEVTPTGEERGPKYPVTFNVYVNNRDDLAALEQQIMTVFRGV
jgi:hypothetical protein